MLDKLYMLIKSMYKHHIALAYLKKEHLGIDNFSEDEFELLYELAKADKQCGG